MASANEFDFSKAFDRYLHDYLMKKKRFRTAAIFKKEANVDKPALIDTPKGFLHEWWSVFYDVYISRQTQREASAEEASVQSVNTHLVAEHLVRNQKMAGQVPERVGFKRMLDQPDACLFAAKQFEEEQLRMAAQNYDPMTQFIDINKLILPNPVDTASSHLQRQTCNMDQGQGVMDYGYGNTLGKTIPVDPILLGTQKPLMSLPGPYASGASEVTNQVALPGQTLQSPNYQPRVLSLKRQPVLPQGMVPMTRNITSIDSASSSEVIQHNPNLSEGDMRNTQFDIGKDQLATLRIGDKTKDCDEAEMNKTLDGILVSLAQEKKNANITSSLRCQSRAGNKTENKGFSFHEVCCLHSSTGQVLCCHFSSDGRLLASAGQEKKVLLWNMENFDSFKSSEGHDHLITDIRFRPNTNIFATSSFDKTVKIWDAARPNKSLFQLSGHKDKVISLDFHPTDTHILCSCDGNDEIRLWDVNRRSCLNISKGAATKQVRFQPHMGNLVAAATGKGVNVIDLETNNLQFCIKGHKKDVVSMCWDSSGKYIASISEDVAQIWSVSDKNCLHKLQCNGKKFQSCVFHPGYEQLLVIGSNQMLKLWNPSESRQTRSVEAHKGLVSCLADSVKSKKVASASHDLCVKVWV